MKNKYGITDQELGLIVASYMAGPYSSDEIIWREAAAHGFRHILETILDCKLTLDITRKFAHDLRKGGALPAKGQTTHIPMPNLTGKQKKAIQQAYLDYDVPSDKIAIYERHTIGFGLILNEIMEAQIAQDDTRRWLMNWRRSGMLPKLRKAVGDLF